MRYQKRGPIPGGLLDSFCTRQQFGDHPAEFIKVG
jgi:hypothetical protein